VIRAGLLTAVAVVATVIPTAQTQARYFPPTTALKIGAELFGPAPCGEPKIHYLTSREWAQRYDPSVRVAFRELYGYSLSSSVSDAWAWADAQFCEIVVNRREPIWGDVPRPDNRDEFVAVMDSHV
jgi:hypothetical protein